MNIVAMAMQYLSPMLIDRIAASLGVQSPLVKTAIAAILPSILAGFTGVAAKPGGGGQLSDILGKQAGDILGNLGNILGGSQQAQAAQTGNTVLRDLLGGPTLSGLTGAVSKFAGTGEGATQSLIGMLAPVALGTLAKQKKDAGLDANGLTNLLMSQKDNIRAAMPPGFDKLLAGTGLLDAVVPASAGSAPTIPRVMPTPAPTTQPKAGGLGMWPLIIAAIALAALGWSYLGNRPTRVALPAPPQITLGNQDIGANLGSIVENLRGTLTGMTDAPTAQAAVPRLQDVANQLGGIQETASKLPPDARRTLATYAAQLLPLLRPLIDRALAASGVGPIAKPVVDQIINRLEALAKA